MRLFLFEALFGVLILALAALQLYATWQGLKGVNPDTIVIVATMVVGFVILERKLSEILRRLGDRH